VLQQCLNTNLFPETGKIIQRPKAGQWTVLTQGKGSLALICKAGVATHASCQPRQGEAQVACPTCSTFAASAHPAHHVCQGLLGMRHAALPEASAVAARPPACTPPRGSSCGRNLPTALTRSRHSPVVPHAPAPTYARPRAPGRAAVSLPGAHGRCVCRCADYLFQSLAMPCSKATSSSVWPAFSQDLLQMSCKPPAQMTSHLQTLQKSELYDMCLQKAGNRKIASL